MGDRDSDPGWADTELVGDDVINESALRSYLAASLGSADTFTLSPTNIGFANETYYLTWGNQDLVLRRPPVEPRAHRFLHGLSREQAIISALSNTWVPVPEIRLHCDDPDIVGTEFYVMSQIQGDVIQHEERDRFSAPRHRERIGLELIDTLSKLHNIDHEKIDLPQLETPDNHIARQLEALTSQLEWAQEVTATVRDVPKLHDVRDWLESNAPETRQLALIHGDYKPDNVLFAPGTPPLVAGVVDWEMSKLGDPLTDLGWLLANWHEPRDRSLLTDDLRAQYRDHERFDVMEDAAENHLRFMDKPGYPQRSDLVARYERQTGLEFEHEQFFRALGAFKMAVLAEGLYRRAVEDSQSAKQAFDMMEVIAPVIAEQASLIADGNIPL